MTDKTAVQGDETFLVKHVTGRVLLDSGRDGIAFSLSGADGAWRVAAAGVRPEAGAEIVRLAAELNLFYFVDQPGGDPPIRKWWLYGKHRQPLIEWDAEAGRLALTVDTRVEYRNDRVIL